MLRTLTLRYDAAIETSQSMLDASPARPATDRLRWCQWREDAAMGSEPRRAARPVFRFRRRRLRD